MFVGKEDLERVDVLQGVSSFALNFLMKNTVVRKFNPSSTPLMSKGSSPHYCYFILDGICHVRNPEVSVKQYNKKITASDVERHQGFRGAGDALGITAALAHYAHRHQSGHEADGLHTRGRVARARYAELLRVGQNTAHTYAVTPVRLLECPRDVLLTAIQICPTLIANIAWTLSLRMNQDTKLQQHASQDADECLPSVAQFLYEREMVFSAYSGADPEEKALPDKKLLGEWLRVNNNDAVTSALEFLRLTDAAVERLKGFQGFPGITGNDDLERFRALGNARGEPGNTGQEDGEREPRQPREVINVNALLWWCHLSQEDSKRLIGPMIAPKTKDGSVPAGA